MGVAKDFGAALFWMKTKGYRVARDEWRREKFIVLRHGYPEGIAINEATATDTGMTTGDVCRFDPYLMMGYADGASPSGVTFRPWTPTVEDVLAEDWWYL